MPFGGNAVILVGDFFQQAPTSGTSLYSAMVQRYVLLHESPPRAGIKDRANWKRAYQPGTPMEVGTSLLLQFAMVTLPTQMRSV
eukprot:2732727-Pyramimonas_sp.AAC.1